MEKSTCSPERCVRLRPQRVWSQDAVTLILNMPHTTYAQNHAPDIRQVHLLVLILILVVALYIVALAPAKERLEVLLVQPPPAVVQRLQLSDEPALRQERLVRLRLDHCTATVGGRRAIQHAGSAQATLTRRPPSALLRRRR